MTNFAARSQRMKVIINGNFIAKKNENLKILSKIDVTYLKRKFTLYYMGGHFVPPHVGYPSWFVVGCPKWAHISWLCFIYHFIGPIEAIFQKKNLKILKNLKIKISYSDTKGSPLWKKSKNWKNFDFSQKNQSFYTWIWILQVLSFLLSYMI